MLILAVVSVTTTGAPDPSWPQYRGPNHDGHVPASASLAVSSNHPPRLLWRTLIGQGYSGLAVADDRVYTLSQSSYGQYLVCLDIHSGKVIWQSRLGFPSHLNDEYPGPYATPAMDGDRIIYADYSGRIGCVEARRGHPLWKLNPLQLLAGEGADFGYAASPMVERGRIYLPIGGKDAAVVALEATTGAVVWRNGNDRASYATCLPITVQGHHQGCLFSSMPW